MFLKISTNVKKNQTNAKFSVCLFNIHTHLGRMDAPKERKTLWGICCYLFDFSRSDCFSCRSLSDSRNAAFLILTFGASTTLSDQILRTDGARSVSTTRTRKCTDAINRVSTNNHSKSYRRCVQRLNESPFSVQTERAPSLRRTRKCTDEVKFDSGTSAALSDRKKQ